MSQRPLLPPLSFLPSVSFNLSQRDDTCRYARGLLLRGGVRQAQCQALAAVLAVAEQSHADASSGKTLFGSVVSKLIALNRSRIRRMRYGAMSSSNLAAKSGPLLFIVISVVLS
jgi:hypothetical protein